MKASIILAHPNSGSFNHAIASAAGEALAGQGWQIRLHDLYAEGFDPLLSAAELLRDPELPPEILQHCEEIVSADAVVIVHPNWWGQPPAILKGWQDRILRMGIAYKFQVNEKGEGIPVGLLKARWACVFTTSNTPAEAEKRMFGDPLHNLWTRCILEFCGVKAVQRKNFEAIISSTPEQRAGWLEETRRVITNSLLMSR